MKTQLETAGDPLAYASELPNLGALQTECDLIQTGGAGRLAHVRNAEDVQYNRRAGKSHPPDGKRHQKNAARDTIVRPYDGAPDSDVHLADEIVLAEVDIYLMAAEMAQPGTHSTYLTGLTAAQTAELKAVAEYCRRASSDDMRDHLELLAQMTAKLGWSVLNPGWRETWTLMERDMDLPTLLLQVAQSVNPESAQQLHSAIMDPSLEDSARKMVSQLFAHLPAASVKAIVTDLRTTGTTTFLDRVPGEKRPTLRTLIQGYNYFVSHAAGPLNKARLHLVVERFSQAELEEMAASENWNPDFVQRAIATAGQYSELGLAMEQKAVRTSIATDDRSIELHTTFVYQFDPDLKAAGWYCTTFSPHVRPGTEGVTEGVTEGDYAKHYLLAYACGAPFIQARRMVEGPGLDDSRGIPEMLQGDQAIMKMLLDAIVARGHLETDPPRAFMGPGWTQVEGWNKPGAKVQNAIGGAGSDVKELGPTRGNPAIGDSAMERLEAGARRRFALPNTTDGSHPSAWQTRQVRLVKRFLSALAAAVTQQVVLCYQEFDPVELAAIIGRQPQLTLDDVLKHRITLTFDVRGMDNDWRKDTLDTMMQLLQIDKGGLVDTGLLIGIIGNMIDPTIMNAVLRDPAGASAAVYKQVEQEIGSIMDGNPPQLSEGDATAGMQLKMAFQILGQNELYQQKLQQMPKIAENLKTWLANKQHNVQETQISPQQGKLGVAQQPQIPVRTGAAQQ